MSSNASLLAPDLEEIKREKARRRLIPFAQRTFPKYRPAPHHYLIAEKLEAVERGELDRLMIFTPPRHGKSELASIRFPAWYLGRNPDRRVIGTSYAAALAFGFSRQARNILADPAWPFDVRLADDQSAIQEWSLKGHRGGFVAGGVGGPITGKGADLLLIDDPFKNREEADSATVRDAVWQWYTSTAYTRLEGAGAVVLIMTRWHHADLAGRLLAETATGGDRWEVLHLPALDDAGNALWPEKYDAAALARIKTAVGSRDWAALYQGTPTDDESAIFKREWWRYYTEQPAAFAEVVQSWDCAFKDLATSDYVVGQVWGRVGADVYLLDQVRGRMSFTATVEAIRGMSARWPQSTAILVEDKANGTAVIETLKHELSGVIAVEPEGGKVARAFAVQPQIEAGNTYLPAAAPWVRDYIEEFAQFPNGVNDDQVDATTQALRRLGGRTFTFTAADLQPAALGAPVAPLPHDPQTPAAARFLADLKRLGV